jgi:hypothetical protein
VTEMKTGGRISQVLGKATSDIVGYYARRWQGGWARA